MSLVLYATDVPMNVRRNAAAAIAKIACVNLETPHFMPPDGDNDDYKRNCHPIGRNPALQTEEGYLFESGAICRYLARLGDKVNAGLNGRTAYQAGQVDQWIDFSNSELAANLFPPLLMHLGIYDKDEKVLAECVAKLHEALCGLNQWLEVRTFLVGEAITAADIVVACFYDGVLNNGVASFHGKYTNIDRLYNTMFHQSKFVEALRSCGHTGQPAKCLAEAKK